MHHPNHPQPQEGDPTMSEQDAAVAPEAAAAVVAETAPTAAADDSPPAASEGWDGDFNAERAQATIKKIRAEKAAAAERARKAEDRATNLEAQAARAAELEAQLVRERVARRIGLPDALVDRLRGSTEDEVMADAEHLVALVAPKAKPAPATKPVEALQPGSGTPTQSGPVQLSRADLAGMTPDQIVAAKAAGQLNTLLGVR